jgi:hypothetical protein
MIRIRIKITAIHTTEPIRMALVRADEEAARTVAQLEAAGYWQEIKAEAFLLEPRQIRRAW